MYYEMSEEEFCDLCQQFHSKYKHRHRWLDLRLYGSKVVDDIPLCVDLKGKEIVKGIREDAVLACHVDELLSDVVWLKKLLSKRKSHQDNGLERNKWMALKGSSDFAYVSEKGWVYSPVWGKFNKTGIEHRLKSTSIDDDKVIKALYKLKRQYWKHIGGKDKALFNLSLHRRTTIVFIENPIEIYDIDKLYKQVSVLRDLFYSNKENPNLICI